MLKKAKTSSEICCEFSFFILDSSLEVAGEGKEGAGCWLQPEAGQWLQGDGEGSQKGPGGAREADGALSYFFKWFEPLKLVVRC